VRNALGRKGTSHQRHEESRHSRRITKAASAESPPQRSARSVADAARRAPPLSASRPAPPLARAAVTRPLRRRSRGPAPLAEAMPKRSCPFGEAAPLQLKTRVGLRELSRGVRGEEYRREIFGETGREGKGREGRVSGRGRP